MKVIDRRTVFEEYPTIGTLVRSFQSLGFDPEEDNPEDAWCDAMLLPERKIDFANYILMVPHDNISTYAQRLSAALQDLLSQLSCAHLLLLGHAKLNLFGNPQLNDSQLNRARSKLQTLVGQPPFVEMVLLEASELAEWIDVFFWLSREDPSVPEYVFWVDNEQRFCFFICRYGNIHLLSLYGKDLIGEEELQRIGFRVGEDYDQFNL